MSDTMNQIATMPATRSEQRHSNLTSTIVTTPFDATPPLFLQVVVAEKRPSSAVTQSHCLHNLQTLSNIICRYCPHIIAMLFSLNFMEESLTFISMSNLNTT